MDELLEAIGTLFGYGLVISILLLILTTIIELIAGVL